jgi:hydroxyacylglutathione hydrolase
MDFITDYENGILAVDSGCGGRPRLTAVHFIIEKGRAALVDTAMNSGVPRLMAALAAQGLAPEQVDFVILTHIHLDHAGAAGTLMTLLPQARLVVHPRGARHMADPAKLIEGTIAVYGAEAVRRIYGDILPIPAERIVEAQHGQTLDLNGRKLLLLDTPGHARHHICIRDERTGHIFTGDTFGFSYREYDRDGRCFAFPTTTPVQFDPPALHHSIDMLMAYSPEALYVTHFGQVRDIPRLGADLHRLIDALVALALPLRDAGESRHAQLKRAIQRLAVEEAAEKNWGLQGAEMLHLLNMDLELNAQGLGVWLDATRAA